MPLDRVLLGQRPDGAYGLFVSKPGYDVKSATSEQMLFDSRLGHYGSVLVSGTATAGSTVSFGQTLPYVPLAYVSLVGAGSTIKGYQFFSRKKTSGELPGHPSQYDGAQLVRVPYYRITASSLEIVSPTWYNDSAAHSYTVRYIVWRCPGT